MVGAVALFSLTYDAHGRPWVPVYQLQIRSEVKIKTINSL